MGAFSVKSAARMLWTGGVRVQWGKLVQWNDLASLLLDWSDMMCI